MPGLLNGICIECQEGKCLQSGKCVSGGGNGCLRCNSGGCTECRSRHYSTKAASGVHVNCYKCPENCEECDSGGCTKCRSNTFQRLITPKNTPKSYFECIPCHSSCEECDEGGCTSCSNHMEFLSPVSLANNSSGSKVGQMECKRCTGGCKECGASGCRECSDYSFLRSTKENSTKAYFVCESCSFLPVSGWRSCDLSGYLVFIPLLVICFLGFMLYIFHRLEKRKEKNLKKNKQEVSVKGAEQHPKPVNSTKIETVTT